MTGDRPDRPNDDSRQIKPAGSAQGPGGAGRRFAGLFAWSLAGQVAIWAVCAGGALAFLHTSQDRWYVLARTRFLGVFVRHQVGMLRYYVVVALIVAVWLWIVRTAWVRTLAPRRRGVVRAVMVGLSCWLFATVMGYAAVFHFGSFWSVTSFLSDKYGLVIRYSDVAPAGWAVRVSVWILGLLTGAAAVRLMFDWPRRAVLVTSVTTAAVVLAVMVWPTGGSARASYVPAARGSQRPNVIILASDSLRADHLGCYGYKAKTGRDTSPNIDALAAEGVVMEDLLTATGSTTDSWLSTLSGRWPHEHGIRCVFPTHRMAEAATDVPTIVRTANEYGYRTVVVGDWAASGFDSVDYGFQVCRVDREMTFPDYIARVTEQAHLWLSAVMRNPLCRLLGLGLPGDLNRNGYRDILKIIDDELARSDETGQPLLLVAFSSVTHMPYRVYDEFDVRFGNPNYTGPHERAMNLSLYKLLAEGASEEVKASLRRIIDLYDTTVWIFDYMVGRVVDNLRSRGMLDDSIVIITTDHGEDFFDPNTDTSHGKYLAAGLQSFRLPMIIHWPGRLQPHRVRHMLRGIDVGPTLLDLTGMPALPGASGKSFAAHLRASLQADLDAIADDRTCFFETGFLWDCPATHPLGGEHLGYPTMSLVVQPDPGWDYRMVIPQQMYPTVMRAKDRAILRGDWKLVYLAMRGRPTLRLYNVRRDPDCLKPVPFENGPFQPLARDLHAWITADPHQEFYLYEAMTRWEFDRLFQVN